MTKFLIGVATAALWFVLSHAANAERICRQVCDNGACVSRCIQRSDSEVILRDRERPRHHEHFDADAPTGDVVIHR